jgi:tetratricopeptide (TPR) repeat protein
MSHRHGIRDRLRQGSRLGLGVLLATFGPALPGPSSGTAPPSPALEVEYAGCQAVLVPGPVCVLGEKRELRLWVGAPLDAQIELQVDGSPADAEGEAVQEGQRFSLSLPPGAKRVDVVAEAPEGRASWFLPLAEPKQRARDVRSEVRQAMSVVDRDIRSRHLGAVRETLAGLRIPLKAPAEIRCLVAYYRSLLAEREGDYRTALAEIQKAAGVAERTKLDLQRWMSEEQWALLLTGVGRFKESAELFERLARTPHHANSCEEARLLNNQAWSMLLGREAGESFEDPTGLLARALEAYETCPQVTPAQEANVLINLALAHTQEDRIAQAKDLLARAHEREPRPSIPHRLWQLDLESRIALREGRPAEALDRFANLEELASATGSSDGRLRAALGEARSQEALGDRTAALETLGRAEDELDEQSLQIPLYEGRETFMATRQAIVSLHVKLLLEQSRTADALTVARHGWSRLLRQLERSDRLANLAPKRRTRWEGLLTAYQEKRSALEERAQDDWQLPEDQLHQEQAARRAEADSAKQLLDEAFRVLGGPGKRQEEAPPPPRSGELILAYHPLPHGWVGFAADRESVRAHRFELAPGILSRPEELAERVLLPFRASIERAKRIRILPSGPLQDVDFQALPFDGDLLLARAPVVYGLDLPVSALPAQPPGRHALLVADARDDLPGALGEARTVRQVLESGSRPWITEELKGAQASAKAVRERLPAADLLHYAGHGTFSGPGGWESGLLLAEDSRLTLGDLLALDRVPAWVVLSGCDTGRSAPEIPVESLGLAHAFLLAGARAVIASTRPANDRRVPAFFTDLYRQWDREPDLAVALQRAQLAWRKRNPGADWASFRLFEP